MKVEKNLTNRERGRSDSREEKYIIDRKINSEGMITKKSLAHLFNQYLQGCRSRGCVRWGVADTNDTVNKGWV